MAEVVIREPTSADVSALTRVHVETWRSTYAQLLPEGFFSADFTVGRERIWRSITTEPRSGRVARLAERDGRVIGFAVSGPAGEADGDAAGIPGARQLFSIYLEPAEHGSGVGQALLDAVLDDRPALLWVAERNPRARAFYERNGFRLDGGRHVDDATPGLLEVRMVRARGGPASGEVPGSAART